MSIFGKKSAEAKPAAGDLPAPASELSLGPLVVNTREVRAGGETLTLRARGLVELAQMYQHLKPVLAALEAAPDGTSISQGIALAAGNADVAQGLIQAAAIGAGKPLDWVAQLPGEEQLDLVCAVLEVNGDFFVRSLLPKSATLLANWMARLLAGPTSSSYLSTTGTHRIQ
jgi:hypothetical protein